MQTLANNSPRQEVYALKTKLWKANIVSIVKYHDSFIRSNWTEWISNSIGICLISLYGLSVFGLCLTLHRSADRPTRALYDETMESLKRGSTREHRGTHLHLFQHIPMPIVRLKRVSLDGQTLIASYNRLISLLHWMIANIKSYSHF